MLLEKYNNYLHENTPMNQADRNDSLPRPRQLYVLPSSAPKPSKVCEMIAAKSPFVITVSQWETSDGNAGSLVSRGTVHSKALNDSTDLNILTLADLRKRIAGLTAMSTRPSIHKYCTIKGVTVADESMTFADYLQLEETEEPTNAALPSVPVVYKLNSMLNQPKINLDDLPGKAPKVDTVSFSSMVCSCSWQCY